jgi:hypothetical protein
LDNTFFKGLSNNEFNNPSSHTFLNWIIYNYTNSNLKFNLNQLYLDHKQKYYTSLYDHQSSDLNIIMKHNHTIINRGCGKGKSLYFEYFTFLLHSFKTKLFSLSSNNNNNNNNILPILLVVPTISLKVQAFNNLSEFNPFIYTPNSTNDMNNNSSLLNNANIIITCPESLCPHHHHDIQSLSSPLDHWIGN